LNGRSSSLAGTTRIEFQRPPPTTLIKQYDLPSAEFMRLRMTWLNSEFKEKTPGVKLGVYEQNIGLKYGSPRKP
jgi:hypothetical protein